MKNLPIRKRTILAVAVLLAAAAILFFAYGFYVGRFQVFPYDKIVYLAKSLNRTVKVARQGESGYVESQLAAQRSPATQVGVKQSLLETALLPLTVRTVDLRSAAPFPMGAGSLARESDHLLLLDRLGRIYSYRDDKLTPLALPAVPNHIDKYILKSERQGGLDRDTFRTHTIAYDAKRSTLYVSFEEYASPAANRFGVAALAVDPQSFAARGEWKTIYESSDTNSREGFGLAGGGKLLVSNDTLYFSIGDYGLYRGADRRLDAAQDPASPFGKIHAYDLVSGKLTVVSSGHRNTQGLVVTRDGELLNVEHGPQGGDEINNIRQGGNYGWPLETYGTGYGAYTWPLQEKASDANLLPPLFAFVPSIGTSSIVQLQGFHERWDGDLLVGSLKGQSLYRLKLVSGRIVFSEPIWIGHRIRDIVQIGARLYLLTDDALMLEVSVDSAQLARNVRSVDEAFSGAVEKCMVCHHFGETNPTQMAPTLSNLNGRKVAGDSFARYSPALRGVQGNWSADRLAQFIADPDKFAPGTAMPKIALSAGEIKEVVDLLTGEGGPAGRD